MSRPTTVAVTGPCGGAGRTSLVAQVARRLFETGRIPMAFDLDPQNALGLHLGMAPGEPLGITHPGVARHEVADLMRRHKARVPFLPFGATSEQELRTLEYQTARDRSWLSGRLETLVPNNCRYAVLDAPAQPGPWQRAAIGAADLIVMFVRPDAASFTSLPRAEAHLREVLGPEASTRSVWALGRFDPCRRLDRDVRVGFERALGERLMPTAVTECASVGEALARGAALDPADGSPALEDFARLTEELVEAADRARETRERAQVGTAPNRLRLAAVAGMAPDEPWLPDEGKGRYHVQR